MLLPISRRRRGPTLEDIVLPALSNRYTRPLRLVRMARRKWIPPHKYNRMPHGASRSEGLWWCQFEYDDLAPDSRKVFDRYRDGSVRCRPIPNGLLECLRDLTTKQQISSRKTAYWTVDAYARHKGLNISTLCSRLRKLEKIAFEILPDRVPEFRKRMLRELTLDEIWDIVFGFYEHGDYNIIAHKFGIPKWRIGQLIKDEKAIRSYNRFAEMADKARVEMEADLQARRETVQPESDPEDNFKPTDPSDEFP